jgi:hypothetical protein
MFKLVGCEDFKVGESQCRVKIEPYGLFAYRYSLEVNGKPFKQFIERQSKILKTWAIKTVDGSDLRVVLGENLLFDSHASFRLKRKCFVAEKDTMDIWVNGQRVDTQVRLTFTFFLFCSDSIYESFIMVCRANLLMVERKRISTLAALLRHCMLYAQE